MIEIAEERLLPSQLLSQISASVDSRSDRVVVVRLAAAMLHGATTAELHVTASFQCAAE